MFQKLSKMLQCDNAFSEETFLNLQHELLKTNKKLKIKNYICSILISAYYSDYVFHYNRSNPIKQQINNIKATK